jgi:GNAT superfamily N-acetyltransferase
MFDIPAQDKQCIKWEGDMPIEERDWQIGLIVGPSGSGKSTIARDVFGACVDRRLDWGASSVVDDFDKGLGMDEIARACQAVGFNTIPAWMRPYRVLSNGEKFRVELARRLLEAKEHDNLVVMDEFTSVVDRQVAQIGSYAVQKFVRKNPDMRFVGVSCHYDIIDWLNPDWVFQPSTMGFEWRCLRPRPKFEVTISAIHYSSWKLFSPFHYMSADLHKAARCYGLFINDKIVAFVGLLHSPTPSRKARNIKRVSRIVTLPDWQGMGLAFVLLETVAAAYKTLGHRVRNMPAHPSFVRSHMKSKHWKITSRPFNTLGRKKSHFSTHQLRNRSSKGWKQRSRGNYGFEYVGPRLSDVDDAKRLLFPNESWVPEPKEKGGIEEIDWST